MRAPPQISVVIPHLNERADLARCLAALERQRGGATPEFEVIVADNGSRELPVEVCDRYPYVRLISETNPGPGPARSRGAAEAQASIIAFIDCDCVAQPGWLAQLAAYFDAHPQVDVIAGSIGILRADQRRPTPIELYEELYSYRVKLYVERDHYAATGNMAVRKSAFGLVGPFGGIGTMEDRAWGQRAIALGHQMAYVPQARVLTPACRSRAEIERRWERHIAHDFREKVNDMPSRLRWLATSAAIAVSPAAEAIRLSFDRRGHSAAQKLIAFGVLLNVRFYRARQMIALMGQNRSAEIVNSWNRS